MEAEDTRHKFQCKPGREYLGCTFNSWRGYGVLCMMDKDDPAHFPDTVDAADLKTKN